jgi:hypothetical protein
MGVEIYDTSVKPNEPAQMDGLEVRVVLEQDHETLMRIGRDN